MSRSSNLAIGLLKLLRHTCDEAKHLSETLNFYQVENVIIATGTNELEQKEPLIRAEDLKQQTKLNVKARS